MSILRRVLKWLGILVAVLAGLVVVFAIYVYIVSDRAVNKTYAVPNTTIAIPDDPDSIAEGQRLATLRGCYGGCHGPEANGSVFVDEPMLARLVAPNLTWALRERSVEELEKIIRHGVYPHGRSTLAMPSSMFYLLSDRDLGAILAFLRSLPPTEGPEPEISLGPLARLGLAMGEFTPQAAEIDHDAPRPVVDGADTVAYGRYLARTVCTECHGLDLRGGGFAPDLVVGAGYSETDFERLMRTGKALGDRELGLMSRVAQSRFSHFTDAEISALYAFLKEHAFANTNTNEDE